jgi:hypothetical protein
MNSADAIAVFESMTRTASRTLRQTAEDSRFTIQPNGYRLFNGSPLPLTHKIYLDVFTGPSDAPRKLGSKKGREQ